MSTGGGSKKGRFTSLVSQSSNPKIPKKEAESSAKGMTVFSVESVYWDVEKSSDSIELQRSSKVKGHEKSGLSTVNSENGNSTNRRVEPLEKQERTSRKKFREDFETYKSTCSISEDGVYRSEKQGEAFQSTGHGKPFHPRAPRAPDASEVIGYDNFSRKDISRRRSYNVASDAIKVVDEGRRIGGKASNSSQLKPAVRSVDYSSGDSCFSDPFNEPQPAREPHRRARKQIQADRNVRNIPSSSLLQPPSTKFRSRSSQKHSKKTPFRPLQPSAQQVASGIALGPGQGTNSLEDLNSSAISSHHLWEKLNITKQRSDAQTSTLVDLRDGSASAASLERCPSDLNVEGAGNKKHDFLDNLRDEVLKTTSLSLPIPSNDVESNTQKRVASSDNVFYDKNDLGQQDDKKIKMLTKKRSMSADSLFQKAGSSWSRNFLGKEEGFEIQGLLPPSNSDVPLKLKHSKLFLSLHSLRSPNKHKKFFRFEKFPRSSRPSPRASTQQRTDSNVLENLFSEIQLDPKSPGDRRGTEKKNAMKRLIRTWSSGNCFGKGSLSSPMSARGTGSLSYESSV